LGEFLPKGWLFIMGIFFFTEAVQIFQLLYPSIPFMYLFRQKMGWATFRAAFSQTHLVTLPACGPTHRWSYLAA
jgi:hypothetical protein